MKLPEVHRDLDHEMETARRTIDQDIENHLTAILALKTQRNRLAPISRLPPEILSRVFFFVKIIGVAVGYNFGPYDDDTLEWIKVSHVSAHWRHVAINSPTLWDDPPMENVFWVAEMLKRSKMASLTIEFDLRSFASRRMAELKEILRQHGSRIKYLSIASVRPHTQKILEDLPISAPRLETLRISGCNHLDHLSPHDDSDDVLIPNGILANTENLCQLELSGCKVYWISFSLSNITHLKLHHISKSTRPTLPQFMRALGKTTKLESLDLKDNILDPTHTIEDDTFSSGLIDLRHLKNLSISSTTAELKAFFNSVTFPPSAIVHAIAFTSDNTDADFSAILFSMARLYSNLIATQKFQTLVLNLSSRAIRFRLHLETVTEYPYVAYSKSAFTLELATKGANFGRLPMETAISSFFKSGLPLDEVSHAHLDFDSCSISHKTLARTVGILPELSSVKLEGCTGNSFIKALVYPRCSVADANSIPLYFTELVSICLSVIFKYQDPYSETNPYDVDFEQLQDCLIQRYECGVEIEKLSLEDCFHLTKENILKLEDIVVDVDWDHIEQNWRDSDEEQTESDSSDYY